VAFAIAFVFAYNGHTSTLCSLQKSAAFFNLPTVSEERYGKKISKFFQGQTRERNICVYCRYCLRVQTLVLIRALISPSFTTSIAEWQAEQWSRQIQ
jgi:hypothetical protein